MVDGRQAIIETGLAQVAERLGDITQPVIDLFYLRYPDARASFAHHAPNRPESLEAEMVGNTLYYVMIWFDNPVEARIAFDSSVPHHRVALGVPPDWYRGFIEAFFDTVEGALDAGHEEARVWSELRGALVGLVERNRLL